MDDLDEPVRRALTEARLELSLEFHAGAGRTEGGRAADQGRGRTDDRARRAREPRGDERRARAPRPARLPTTPLPPRQPTPPPAAERVAAVEASVLVAGVDGYRKGWVAVSLDPSGDVQVSTHSTFAEVLSLQARVIAVDIPIDPPGLGARPADAGARAFVGGRASSVFPTPPRAALEARTFAEANEIARTITGKGISQQAFALGRKILEVHSLADVDERVIEMHPEVSFCALAGGPLRRLEAHGRAGSTGGARCSPTAGIRLPGAVPGRARGRPARRRGRRLDGGPLRAAKAKPFPPEHAERLGAIWR